MRRKQVRNIDKIAVSGHDLDIETFARASRNFSVTINLTVDAKERIVRCRQMLEGILDRGEVVYGINTGFGSLADVRIGGDGLTELQRNLIRSHTAGCGKRLPREVVRGAMILRLNTLALGHSGVRLELAQLIESMINADIYPHIPRFGSVGASGDLALLSAMALAMIEPTDSPHQPMVDVLTDTGWKQMKSAEALKLKGLSPITLAPKEGLALNNGCQVSASIAALALDRVVKSMDANLISTALTMQALSANISPLDPRIHSARPHAGQAEVAQILTGMLEGSGLVNTPESRVQDAYSLRCYPQVAGSCQDLIGYSARSIETEMNSATDNPLLFNGDPVSGGNFHGAPLAHACDVTVIGATDLASITERRVFRLVTGAYSGLPSFLTDNPGVSSGMMIAQYTCANLVSHAKSLAYPGSVDSIPTCEGQEDHVSMAPVSAFHLTEVAETVTSVTAIELLVASRAVFQKCKSLGYEAEKLLSKSTAKPFEALKNLACSNLSDAPMSTQIETIKQWIDAGMMDFRHL